MKDIILSLLAAGAGVCIALQAVANTRLRSKLDTPDGPFFATYFSICGTILTATLAMLLMRPAAPTWESIREAPKWAWIGGPLGVLFVLAGASLVKELGAGAFVALVVGGQLLASLLFDHFGMMGLVPQPMSWNRALGAVLIVGGAVCIKLF